MRYKLKESYDSPRGRIDREKGIIYDVKILGKKSKNKREYTDDALDMGIPLYENCCIYIDHAIGVKRTNHGVDDHGGVFKNVTRRKDGLWANVHYNRASRAGALVLEAADRFPDKFGFSQHAIVDGYEVDGIKVIERIIKVKSVDLVKDPATTNGIFEAIMEPEVMGWEQALVALQTAVLADTGMDDPTKEKFIKKLNKLKTEISGGAEGEAEAGDSEETPVEETPVKESVELNARIDGLEAKIDKLLEAKESVTKSVVTKVKSAPRSTVTESVTPAAGDKKAPLPKTKDEVISAWGVE